MNLYRELDQQITLFIEAIHDPAKANHAIEKMIKISEKIGGKMVKDVQQLATDFKNHSTKKIIEDALRIKHEVREL